MLIRHYLLLIIYNIDNQMIIFKIGKMLDFVSSFCVEFGRILEKNGNFERKGEEKLLYNRYIMEVVNRVVFIT